MPADLQLPPRILAVIDDLDALRKSRDDAWQVPRQEGFLLHHIALAMQARTIVEVGTSYGFSGLFYAAALQRTGGRLHTIDASEKKYRAAHEAFVAAGVADIVTRHLGDAAQVLPGIPGPIDLAFVDADKPATRGYFDLLWPKIRVGGCILVDNAVTHRKELADFVAHVRSMSDACSTEIGVGNGIEWTIKLA